jgi:hypothetical protein
LWATEGLPVTLGFQPIRGWPGLDLGSAFSMCLNSHTLHNLEAFTIALVDDVKGKGISVPSMTVSGQVGASARQGPYPRPHCPSVASATVAGCMGVMRSSTTSCKASHSYSYPSDGFEDFRVERFYRQSRLYPMRR